MEPKAELRRRLLADRDALPPDLRAAYSAQAAERLFALPEVERAALVMFFVSFGSEIETLPMVARALADAKQVTVPRVDRPRHRLVPHLVHDPEGELVPGAYGILEPSAERPVAGLDALEVVVVPGLAFGEDGFRVGYGGGYYDEFLKRAPRAVRIGLAFEFQVLPTVPHRGRDLPVDLLVTEARVRRFPQVREGGHGSHSAA